MIHFMFEQTERCYYTLASKSNPEFIDILAFSQFLPFYNIKIN